MKVYMIYKFTYLILYNEEMTPYPEVFTYFNNTIESYSINSRIKALTALRLLYIFEHIISKKITEFYAANINNLKSLLRGLSPAGQALSFELITCRSNETINGYLSVYRNFLSDLNCTNSYLFKSIKGKKTSSESDSPHLLKDMCQAKIIQRTKKQFLIICYRISKHTV